MKKVFIFVLFFFIGFGNIFSFDGLLFKPLTANTFEPRVGCLFNSKDNKLRLDIGTSVDLIAINATKSYPLRLGADFFTYTRLRSQGRMKFPVETSDYFFGVNASGKTYLFEKPLFFRIRLAHISSHLVDGFAKDSIFLKMPFVYSREFADIVAAFDMKSVRVYAGLNYIFSTKPKGIMPLNPQAGFDFEQKFNKWFSVRGGYDFKLLGINDVFTAVHTAQLGLFFKTDEYLGVLLNLNGFRGKSIHGMFYNENESYYGFGFQLYFY